MSLQKMISALLSILSWSIEWKLKLVLFNVNILTATCQLTLLIQLNILIDLKSGTLVFAKYHVIVLSIRTT